MGKKLLPVKLHREVCKVYGEHYFPGRQWRSDAICNVKMTILTSLMCTASEDRRCQLTTFSAWSKLFELTGEENLNHLCRKELGCLLWNPHGTVRDDKESTTVWNCQKELCFFVTTQLHTQWTLRKNFPGNSSGKVGDALPTVLNSGLVICMC